MGCEEEKTLLADIAYFNSLTCKVIIRFCSQHVLNKNQAAKKAEPLWVQPKRFVPQNSEGGVAVRVRTADVSPLTHGHTFNLRQHTQ
jgi:hypothetical protein